MKLYHLFCSPTQNIVFDQVATTSRGMATFSSVYNPYHKYTKLFETFFDVMTKLIHSGILKLPPVCPIDTSEPMPKSFDTNGFFQYYYQPGHDTQRFCELKNVIQDLIDSNGISIDVEVNSMNKSVSRANQNL